MIFSPLQNKVSTTDLSKEKRQKKKISNGDALKDE